MTLTEPEGRIAKLMWLVAMDVEIPYIAYANPEGDGVRFIAIMDRDDYDAAEFIVREHNTRLMQIETKDGIILALRREVQGLRRKDGFRELVTSGLREENRILWTKVGDLEARNQRLYDAIAELERELDDLTNWLPTEEEEET